jgi:hypothetical protein
MNLADADLELANTRQLTLHFEEAESRWVAIGADAGPAGTCLVDLPGLWIEFDRLDFGRVVYLTIDSDLDGDVRKFTEAIFGDVPEGEEVWQPEINVRLFAAVWHIADMLRDLPSVLRNSKVRNQGLIADVFTIELAARSFSWLKQLPMLWSGRFPYQDDVSEAALRVVGYCNSNAEVPASLRDGIAGLLRSLAEVFGPNELPVLRNQSSNDPVRFVNVRSERPAFSNDKAVEFEIQGFTGTPVATIVRCNGHLVEAKLTVNSPETVALPLTSGRISIETSSAGRSLVKAFQEAEEAALAARRAEGGARKDSATLWQKCGEAWLAARSPLRAAAAFRRSADLANDPNDRGNLRQIAAKLDPKGARSVPVERVWYSWDCFERSTGLEARLPRENLFEHVLAGSRTR